MHENFLEAARRELSRVAETKTLSQIAAGAGVEAPWLRLWVSGKIPNPGIVLIQRVYDYCKSH